MRYGWLVEGFSILPSININWMHIRDNKDKNKIIKIYDIQFSLWFWYISTDNICKYLKIKGY